MIFKGPEAFGFGAFCLSCNSGKNRAVPDFCVIIECSATLTTATDTATAVLNAEFFVQNALKYGNRTVFCQ